MTKLDDDVKNIFETFKIPCYGDHGQIKLNDLGYTTNPGKHLEFDLIGRVGNIGLIIETTKEKENQRDKIHKFVRHCKLFENSPLDSARKISLLRGIPRKHREDFSSISKWKYIYLGTSPEIVNKRLDKGIEPSSPLYVFNSEHYEYLKLLRSRIGEYGRFELLRALKISPIEADEEESEIKRHALYLNNRKISKGFGPVDLYVFTLSALSLLKISRVIRYGSLDSWIPELGTDYQRLLNSNKLKNMYDFLKKEKGNSAFPNAITVVLSTNVTSEENGGDIVQLHIPLEYGSIEVIDGQHRLFAFAKSGLSESQLKSAKLIVVGVKFHTNTLPKRQRWSARTFVEINKEQTKVPTELINLISYSAMGDMTPKSLGARIIIDLNTKKSGPLSNVFRTRPFQKTNRVGGRAVKIVSITNELERLFRSENVENPHTKGIHECFSSSAWRKLRRGKGEKIISEGRRVISEYFSIVSQVFDKDWKSKNSLIFTTNYMAAFCKLLVEFKRQRRDETQIRTKLTKMKSAICSENSNRNLGPMQEVFYRKGVGIPKVGGIEKASLQAIYEYLKQRT